MSTPHEVARDLRERMESAKRAASNPEAGSVYAFEYLLSACEAACARLDGSTVRASLAAARPCSESDGTKSERREHRTPAGTQGTHAATISDAEAEAVADAACGAPVDSHVSRTYVGPGPERLAKRFPIMGGRR